MTKAEAFAKRHLDVCSTLVIKNQQKAFKSG